MSLFGATAARCTCELNMLHLNSTCCTPPAATARGTAMVVCSGAHVVAVAGLGPAPSPSTLRSSFHLAEEHEALLDEPSQVACLDVFAINPVFENRWAAGAV